MEEKTIIAEAVAAMKKGGIILYPTDTVWGLGCDATDPEAVAKIYGIKKRSDSKSLVLLASDMDMIARYVKEIPEMAVQLVEATNEAVSSLAAWAKSTGHNASTTSTAIAVFLNFSSSWE